MHLYEAEETYMGSCLSFLIWDQFLHWFSKGIGPSISQWRCCWLFLDELILCARLHICQPQAMPVTVAIKMPPKVMDKFSILIMVVVSLVYAYVKINQLYTLLYVIYSSVKGPNNAPSLPTHMPVDE